MNCESKRTNLERIHSTTFSKLIFENFNIEAWIDNNKELNPIVKRKIVFVHSI